MHPTETSKQATLGVSGVRQPSELMVVLVNVRRAVLVDVVTAGVCVCVWTEMRCVGVVAVCGCRCAIVVQAGIKAEPGKPAIPVWAPVGAVMKAQQKHPTKLISPGGGPIGRLCFCECMAYGEHTALLQHSIVKRPCEATYRFIRARGEHYTNGTWNLSGSVSWF